VPGDFDVVVKDSDIDIHELKPCAANPQADGCQQAAAEHYRTPGVEWAEVFCEEHLKAEVIKKAGAQLRFCSGCGKTHVLGEFDGNRKTCRTVSDRQALYKSKRQQK
jgi:hypothetical protein